MKQILCPLENATKSAKAAGAEELVMAHAKLLGLQACCATSAFETVDGWFFLVDTKTGRRTRIKKSCSFQAKFSANAATTSVWLSSLEFDFLMILIAQDINAGFGGNLNRTFYLIPRERIQDQDLTARKDGSGYDFNFSASAYYEEFRDIPKAQSIGVWLPVIEFFTT